MKKNRWELRDCIAVQQYLCFVSSVENIKDPFYDHFLLSNGTLGSAEIWFNTDGHRRVRKGPFVEALFSFNHDDGAHPNQKA